MKFNEIKTNDIYMIAKQLQQELTEYFEYNFNQNEWDGKRKHWWVEIENIIIDITADQFHPSEPEKYEVIITNKKDQCYHN